MFFLRKSFYAIIIILLSLDFTLSSIVFKKTKFWNHNLYKEKTWRIISNEYHHDLSPFINEIEKWGKNRQRLITNSLGFRDSTNRTVSKEKKGKRILLVGDSFIEGLGYDYEFTLAGLLEKKIGSSYEILNSAVSSYSPTIYYLKTKYLIENGYQFDQVLVFLDVSDIVDEMYLEFDSKGKLKIPKGINKKNNLKNKFYDFAHFSRDNFIIFRFLSILSDNTEVLKNNLKNRYFASQYFNKRFYNVDTEELNLYKMINVDRGRWTLDLKSYKEVELGIKSSEKSLSKLFQLLKEKNIDSYLIIYPWPNQIINKDAFHQNHWINFSKKNNINFFNLYQYFDGNNKKKIVYENFIPGDVHWNKKGTAIVFNAIIENEILKGEN